MSPPTMALLLARSCEAPPPPASGLTTPCWLWKGARNSFGYGSLRTPGKTFTVHRLACELAGRPIPKGLVGDHLCRVRHCFNPEHIDGVTQRENVRRSPFTIASKNAAKTVCKNGHPFDAENTIILNERGWRDCRACRRAKGKRSNAVEKAKRAARRGT